MDYHVLAESLEKSLTYRMSLGSKELYHSNVWAWLMENDSSFVKCFFDDVNPEDVKNIEREEEHRDITIHLKNSDKVLVIENKLKSIPGQDQLNKYAEGLGESFRIGLLTGLEPTTIVDPVTDMVRDTSKPWRFKKYTDIAKSIREALDASQNQVIYENKRIIAQYCDDIDKMNQIVSAVLDEKKETFFHSHDDSLENLGLNDLINKVNGSEFSRYFWERVAKNQLSEDQLGLDGKHYFHQWEAFNRKQCTLEFRYSSWAEDWKPYLVVGIELQGGTYRRDVEILRSKRGLSHEELFGLSCGMGYFDKEFYGKKSNPDRKILFPGMKEAMRTKMTGPYNKYITDKYINIYQYFELKDETTEKYDTLYQMIINDLRIAKAIFEKRDLLIHPNRKEAR